MAKKFLLTVLLSTVILTGSQATTSIKENIIEFTAGESIEAGSQVWVWRNADGRLNAYGPTTAMGKNVTLPKGQQAMGQSLPIKFIASWRLALGQISCVRTSEGLFKQVHCPKT